MVCATHHLRRLSGPRAILAVALAITAAGFLGCSQTPVEHKPEPYPTLPLAPVPPFMEGTIYQIVRVENLQPFLVGGYGLVVNLHDTGDCTAPAFVRDYLTKQMLIHNFGSSQDPIFSNVPPAQVFKDKRVAIVAVEGAIPVGARKDQRFDLIVRALPRGNTSSLSQGQLYATDLAEHGLQDPSAIGAQVLARAESGDVYVNPVFAIKEADRNSPANLRASLRVGTVLQGGKVTHNRPIVLQVRRPQGSTARWIESRIQDRFQDTTLAAAQDEGLINIYVPQRFKGNWKHFVGVVAHLYLNNSTDFILNKAKQLAEEAHKPGAPLLDISYCWEGLGEAAVPVYAPLLSDPNPDVAFAAARAAAFCGDAAARQALMEMALATDNPYQLPAVRILGELPNTPEINHMLRRLVDSDLALVRIEAYRILAENNDAQLFTKKIGDRFFLDVVDSKGKPMIYATRSGIPRIAVFGEATIETPITYTALDSRLSISSNDESDLLTLFYRDPNRLRPVTTLSHPDAAVVIGHLGGESPPGSPTFELNYADVVGIMQDLCATRDRDGKAKPDQITATINGKKVDVSFVLQPTELVTEEAIISPVLTRDDDAQTQPAATGGGGAPSTQTAGPNP